MLLKIRNGQATRISKIFLFDKKTNNKILSLSSEQNETLPKEYIKMTIPRREKKPLEKFPQNT